MPPAKSHAGHYRPDIDGLRAVAIIAVLAFHAFPDALPGGFVGVDVFFVISGYLISTIIVSGLDRGDFSFITFYARRVRRIFPALAAVLASCLVAGWFLLYADDYASLGRHAAAGAGFVSNLLLWSESGYFDQAAKLKPLLHLWSLGIEEQFYLLWPLALYLGWRSRIGMAKLVGGIALASFAACLWLAMHDPAAGFYAPWSRFWELLAGALLALLHLRRRASAPAPATLNAHSASLLGGILIAIACIVFRESDPFPGWRAMLPVAGACLLIGAGERAFANRTVLALPPMRWIGLVSYPLYLWHWPLLAWLNIRHPEGAPMLARAIAVAASLVLAAATYHAIERPLRFGMHARAKTIGLLVAMAMLAAAGLAIAAHRGFTGRFASSIARYSNYTYDFRVDARIGDCWLKGSDAASAYAEKCVDAKPANGPLLMLWGDSHAGRLYPGLRSAATGRIRIAEFVRNACAPYLTGINGMCARNNRYVISQVRVLHPRVVVLFAAWNRNPHDNPPPDIVLMRLQETLDALHEVGASRIVVMGPAPQWRPDLPNALVRLHERRPYDTPPRYMAFGQVAQAHVLDAYLASHMQGASGVTYISVIDAMCNTSGCLTWVDSPDRLSSWDYGHLTTPGATYLAKKLDLVGRTVRADW